MNTIANNHKFSAAAAFGAAALFSMLSFGSSAEAARVSSCQGPTASSVKSCCEQLVKENGRPVWMVQSGTSCSKATRCRGGYTTIGIAALVAKRCYIQAVYEVKDEGGGHPERPDPGRSTPNTPAR